MVSTLSRRPYIAICESVSGQGPDLRIVDLQEDTAEGWQEVRTIDFEVSSHAEVTASFSPDGNWLAFASNELGQFQVFVRPFKTAGGKRQVSTNEKASYLPAWSIAGHELIFATKTTGHKTGESQVHAVEYSANDETLSFGTTSS